jgi:hypothetical protein
MRRTLVNSLAVLFSIGMFAAGCGDDDTGDDGTSGAGGTPAAGAGAGGTSGSGGTSGGTAGLSGGVGASAGVGAAAGAGEGGGGGAALEEGLECGVLTALCPADSAVGAVQECNQVGRAADAEACVQNWRRCVPLCTGEEPVLGEGGAGGISAAGAGGGAHAEPSVSPYCTALGELCHAVDEGEGTAHECHEVGHVGEPRTCIDRFSSCARFCLDALDAQTSSGGAGGSGGSGGAL